MLLRAEGIAEVDGEMTGLQTLNLHGCSGLKALPESMGEMTGVQTLDLLQCPGLTALQE